MKAILVSYEEDQHVIHLFKRAADMGMEVDLWDVSKFPDNTEISLLISNQSDSICDFFGGEVRGIYWRRPKGRYQQTTLTPIQQYVQLESEVVIRSLFDFLPRINWISAPEPDRLACRKPIQLEVARSLGFRIPRTCITNSPNKVAEFLKGMEGSKITMKPVGTAFIQLAIDGDLRSSENRVVFTRAINPKLILENLKTVKNCPVIFQEVVEKDSDLRITVVDENVYTAEIQFEGCSDPDNLDWRDYEVKRTYSRHVLPENVKNFCVNLLKRLGLRFGCIDMAFSRTSGYTFFEINPQGQWLPSEIKLGYDISGSILKALVS